MQRLTRTYEVPPGGFRVYQPETKTWIKGPTERDWKIAVKKHRASNNIPIGTNFDAEVEDQLCQSLPPGHCHREGFETTPGFRATTFESIVAGTKTLLDWFGTGKRRVPISEATNRAKICSNCPFNMPITACSTCNSGTIRDLVNKIVGGDKTVHDDYLHACSICGCSLKAKIWLEKDLLVSHTSQEQMSAFPAHCWMK